MSAHKMEVDLLAWAQVMVTELYQLKRLKLQTMIVLSILEPAQKKHFWNYLYPLWRWPSGMINPEEGLPLKIGNPQEELPLDRIKAMASNPNMMEMLSAGVGFAGDLRWGDNTSYLIEAAALAGNYEVVELGMARREAHPLAWYAAAAWALNGGNLRLFQWTLEKGGITMRRSYLRQAAKRGQTSILTFLLSLETPAQ